MLVNICIPLMFLLLGMGIRGPELESGGKTYCTAEKASAALGDLSGLPPSFRKFFSTESFPLKTVPGPHDWLANHPESGQTYEEYIRSGPNRITSGRKTIYIQPLGDRAGERKELMGAMEAYLKAFYQTDSVLKPPLNLDREKTVWRTNSYTGQPQALTGSVMENILLPTLPDEAFCTLGVTMEDLYPAPSWNFVFGQASLKERTGLYSLARYDPAFYGEKMSPVDRNKEILRRALKVVAHEIAHMFGLAHCVHFECLMNGSNHMAESDGRPLFLCPVCLRKLYWNIGFDPADRYRSLHGFFRAQGLHPEAEWCRGRGIPTGTK